MLTAVYEVLSTSAENTGNFSVLWVLFSTKCCNLLINVLHKGGSLSKTGISLVGGGFAVVSLHGWSVIH